MKLRSSRNKSYHPSQWICIGDIISIITVRNKNDLSNYKYFGSIVQGCYETIIFMDCQTVVDISVASKTWGRQGNVRAHNWD